MGRSLCSDGNGLKKGPWSPEEDRKLITHIQNHGHPNWRALPKLAGLNRSGKSCRLRWTNYLSPNIKRGEFTQEEVQIIFDLHSVLGNKWSAIAKQLPGRTDNEIKNFWNTHLKKKLIQMGFDPMTHRPRTDLSSSLANIILQAQTLQYYLQYYLQYDHLLQPPHALTNINNYNNPTEVEILNLINSNNNNNHNNNTNDPLQPLGTDSVGQVLFQQLPSLEMFPNNTNTNETAPYVDDHNYYIIDEGPSNCGDACSSSSFVGSSTSIWSDQFLLERSLFHHTPPSPPPDWL